VSDLSDEDPREDVTRMLRGKRSRGIPALARSLAERSRQSMTRHIRFVSTVYPVEVHHNSSTAGLSADTEGG